MARQKEQKSLSPQEFADVAIEHYRNCTDKKKRRQNFWTTVVATFIMVPIVLGVIVGLFAVFIKFLQICTSWIGWS